MTRGRHQHLASPSKVTKVNRLRFFGHILKRPADRLVQRILRSLEFFELGEATWPKTEVLDWGGERGPEDTRRG
ncbi:hypothetical protein RB195_025194 [Necator americanus]|uniref:Uncharacterized protein n=1 Tax=Necator americanus TaxID=51031 RepID=A0ABR1ERA5_NECAM